MLPDFRSYPYRPSLGRATVFVANVAMLLIICRILAIYVQHALVSPPSFDGGMNLNTALSFIEGRGYGFFYDIFFPFPSQTDGPYTLPAGLLMRLGGVHPFTTQGVNLAYFAGTLYACFILLRRMLRSGTQALAGVTLLLLTPYLLNYAMDGYGEVPTFFWFLVSLIILGPQLEREPPSRVWLFVGGVTLALCYLTKVVSLLLVVPTLGLFAILVALRKGSPSESLAWLGAGIVLPIAGWELFRLTELGSFSAYAQWWALQTGAVLSQSGSTETFSSWGQSLMAKGAAHLQLLSYMIGAPRDIVAIFLFVPWLVATGQLIRNWRASDFQGLFCVGVLLVAAGGYFFWWLMISPTYMAWPRRILNGLLLQQILLILAVGELGAACLRARAGAISLPFFLKRMSLAATAATLLVAEGLFSARGDMITYPPVPGATLDPQLALAQVVRDLPPDAKIFGAGWWKAPVLSLFSGRQIMDFYRWRPATIDSQPYKYLVLDAAVKYYPPAAAEFKEILAATTYHVLVDQPLGAIYALDKVLPYAPFTAIDRDSKQIGASFSPASGSPSVTRGLYPAEGSLVWAKPESAILLRRDVQRHFSLSLVVPPALLTNLDEGATLSLDITSPGCLHASVSLVQAGLQTITEPLSCPPAQEPEVMEISLNVNGHIPLLRSIEVDSRRRAFQIVSAQLQ